MLDAIGSAKTFKSESSVRDSDDFHDLVREWCQMIKLAGLVVKTQTIHIALDSK